MLSIEELVALAFMSFLRIGVPILLLSGVLYLLKRWLEPRLDEPIKSRIRLVIPPVLISAVSLVLLFVIGVVVYLMYSHQFIGVLLQFRDLAAIAYLFVLRIGVPLILLLGIGTWLERKLNAELGHSRPGNSERLPRLRGIHLPHLSPRGILAVTILGALWAAFLGVTISRFFFGLSYITNMTDQYPWGLWLVFDMISGVAVSAGGFVMAGTVYVFNIKRYHPIVRPAVLTAFLGYLLAIVGLMFDLGRWYQVMNATYMWNLHSPLIEVAWCVMLYSTVLALEFSPAVFERFNWQVPLRIIRAIMMPIIIAGLVLSTLHQSTLGTLFLIFPEKMNPLWYSPFLPVFFFLSAIATGLSMTIVESNLSARFLGVELESHLLRGLGKAAAVVLFLYAALKVYDLISRGALAYLTVPGLHSTLYWTETGLGVFVPMLILAFKRGRENPRLLFAAAGLVVAGVVMNRLDTGLLGWWNYTNGGPIYIPSLAEIVGSISLVSIGVVAFGLIAKNLPIFEKPRHRVSPAE